MPDLSVKIDLTGNSDVAVRSIRAVTSGLGGIKTASLGAVGGLGKLVQGFSTIGLVALGVGAVARAIEGLGKAMIAPIRSASDLGESVNKVGVIFGQSAGLVTAFATTSAAALGQSRNQALEATGAFGNLFRTIGLGDQVNAKMSISLVGLASDLASFNNVDPTDVLTALRSGLVGETEPLRRFGILLNEAAVTNQALRMGLAKTAAELTEGQKVQARYALILGQTGAAQGDFARTSTGMANSIRIIQAHFSDIATIIGEEVLPVITPLIAEFAQKLPAMIQQARPHIQAFGEAFRFGAEVAIGGLQSLWQAFTTVFTGIVQVAQAAGQLVYQAMSWLNPFASHSPSLVSQVEDGLGKITALYAGLPTAINPHLAAVGVAQGELKDQIAASERALQAGERALKPYERALASVQKTVSKLGDELSTARTKFAQFQNAPLAGERAFDDRIFNVDQDKARLRLEQMDMEEAGPGRGAAARRAFAARRRALEQQMRGADRAGERARLERQVSIDPQRRALDAIGRSPEMTFAAALKGAQEAYATIQRIEPVYERARIETEQMADALAEQRDRLAEQRDLLAEVKAGYEAAGKAAGAGVGAGFTPPKFTPPAMPGPINPDDGPREMSPAQKALFDFQTKVKGVTDTINLGIDAVKTFQAAIAGSWEPGPGIHPFHELVGNIGLGLRELGRIGKLVLDGELSAALEALQGHLDRHGPPIMAAFKEWGDEAWQWVAPAADKLPGELYKLGGKLFEWVKKAAPDFTREVIANWIPAIIVGLGGIVFKLDQWWRATGQQEFGSFAIKMGLAIVEGMVKGLFNLGVMLHNAIIAELRKVNITVPLPGGGSVTIFDGRGLIDKPMLPANDAPPPPARTGGGSRGGAIVATSMGRGGMSAMSVPDAAPGAASNGGGGDMHVTINFGDVHVRDDADAALIATRVEEQLARSWTQATGRGTRRPLGLARATN